MSVAFARVQQILDAALRAWEQRTHRPPQLIRHSRDFGWRSRQQLLDAQAFGKRLIQPELIGSEQAETANLVLALRTGVPGSPRMPIGGPFVAEAEIQEIICWIKEGAPEDPPPNESGESKEGWRA